MHTITSKIGGLYFLDVSGSIGKTFLISLILTTILSRNDTALTIASSGIAATLLYDGQTARSALKLPLNMQIAERPACNITKKSRMDKTLQIHVNTC